MTSNPSLRVSDAVQQAITDHTPVVALESTIFTHGLPRPRNVEVALAGEEIVRAAGGVPATIGVVHGQPVVGLTEDEIRELAYDDDVTKASIRDLSYAAVTGKNAGTTIAAAIQTPIAAAAPQGPQCRDIDDVRVGGMKADRANVA